MPSDPHLPPLDQQHRFATTRWSMVLEAGQRPTTNAAKALATLCEIYWYPLYAFVRRQGKSADDASDLTQEFFVHLLTRDTLQVADRERGRFRSFLLTSLKNFLANERRRLSATKRGGGQSPISIDFQQGESRYQLEPSHEATAEVVFERQWALTLLDRAMTTLRQEFDAKNRQELFEHIKHVLQDNDHIPYKAIGTETGMSIGAVKVAIHRARKRFRTILRDEIAETVDDSTDIEDELNRLFQALAPG